MPLVAHRRVHLRVGAEPLVAVGRHQRQMMRRHLHARPVLVLGEERHLLRRRDVQHVHALAVLLGQPHQALRWRSAPPPRRARRDGEAGSPCRRSRARALSRASSSEWNAARREILAMIRSRRRLVLDQQIAGRRAHEHLDAGRAPRAAPAPGCPRRSRACRRRRRRSRRTCARARGAPCRPASPASVVSGLVFGISNTAVTPPMTAARLPVSRSSLCSRPGSRKCTWVSITPGSTCRPGGVDHLARAVRRERSPIAAMRPSRMPISRDAVAVVVDDGCALDDHVEAVSHAARLLALPPPHPYLWGADIYAELSRRCRLGR